MLSLVSNEIRKQSAIRAIEIRKQVKIIPSQWLFFSFQDENKFAASITGFYAICISSIVKKFSCEETIKDLNLINNSNIIKYLTEGSNQKVYSESIYENALKLFLGLKQFKMVLAIDTENSKSFFNNNPYLKNTSLTASDKKNIKKIIKNNQKYPDRFWRFFETIEKQEGIF